MNAEEVAVLNSLGPGRTDTKMLLDETKWRLADGTALSKRKKKKPCVLFFYLLPFRPSPHLSVPAFTS